MLDSLAPKDDRIGGGKAWVLGTAFQWAFVGAWSEVVEGEDTAIVIRVQTTTGPCANE